jgi:hypothetical protein
VGGSEKWFDGLISENNQCGYGLEARRVGLIATGLADAVQDLLATELLQVIGCAVGPYWPGVCLPGAWTSVATSAAVKPSEQTDEAMTASAILVLREWASRLVLASSSS